MGVEHFKQSVGGSGGKQCLYSIIMVIQERIDDDGCCEDAVVHHSIYGYWERRIIYIRISKGGMTKEIQMPRDAVALIKQVRV